MIGAYLHSEEVCRRTVSDDDRVKLGAVFSNLSMAHLKLGHKEEAAKCACETIRCAPSWFKGHYRLALALIEQEEYFGALRELYCALKLEGKRLKFTEEVQNKIDYVLPRLVGAAEALLTRDVASFDEVVEFLLQHKLREHARRVLSAGVELLRLAVRDGSDRPLPAAGFFWLVRWIEISHNGGEAAAVAETVDICLKFPVWRGKFARALKDLGNKQIRAKDFRKALMFYDQSLICVRVEERDESSSRDEEDGDDEEEDDDDEEKENDDGEDEEEEDEEKGESIIGKVEASDSEEGEGEEGEDVQEMRHFISTLHSNRALALSHLSNPDGALAASRLAVRWDGGWFKAHMRVALALRDLSRPLDALTPALRARALAPRDSASWRDARALCAEIARRLPRQRPETPADYAALDALTTRLMRHGLMPGVRGLLERAELRGAGAGDPRWPARLALAAAAAGCRTEMPPRPRKAEHGELAVARALMGALFGDVGAGAEAAHVGGHEAEDGHEGHKRIAAIRELQALTADGDGQQRLMAIRAMEAVRRRRAVPRLPWQAFVVVRAGGGKTRTRQPLLDFKGTLMLLQRLARGPYGDVAVHHSLRGLRDEEHRALLDAQYFEESLPRLGEVVFVMVVPGTEFGVVQFQEK